ncbi:hypothetical protein ACFQI7_03360 [Paenibacillus allorhizosphaerae]|uniref:Uncharacterized protein n=1 Tax=Paenibacillus allorhizosphaerae TaxID=2849866 RepID=A0ABM8VCW9_9BACL|nr:hypothetical protein [Paenibacillus allorhizosphaerae]CAG7625316.1 hypothetical protein PAECIP111802_01156 [Paenibacillus allorhizosphaerae]
MAHIRKLVSDQDFQEAMERQAPIRVFQNDHVVDAGGIVIRFDEKFVVIQSGVSEIAYHSRTSCEFFSMRKR